MQVLPSGPAGSGSLHQPAGEEVVLRKKKRCRVLFSYQPLHDDELELKVKLCYYINIWWCYRKFVDKDYFSLVY